MDIDTSRRVTGHAPGLVLICALIIAQTGCWTGRLIETGRMHETLLSYERISLMGNEVRLDYVAEISADRSKRNRETARRVRRSAAFAIVNLIARPELPVDVFPLQRRRPGSDAGHALPLRIDLGDRLSMPMNEVTSSDVDWVARIDESDGYQRGFSLCRARGGLCLGHFRSAVLYDDPIAWWVYPIAPFAIAFDIALIPVQLFTLPPLIALSD